VNTLFGMRVITSLAAVTPGGRIKVYPKRRAKSSSHWRRMDKKWRKRYGFKPDQPAMFKMAGGIVGPETLVVHPALMPKLRAAVHSSGGAS
jgi:hypothetical protein